MSPSRRRPVLVLALVAVMAAAGPVRAQDDLDDLRSRREDNRREAADVAARLDALSAEDQELVAALEALDAHIDQQEVKVAAAEQRIAVAEDQAATARAEAEALGDHMDAIRARLRQRAVDAFVSPRLDVVDQLNTDDLLEAALRQSFLDEVVGDEYDLVDALRTSQSEQAAAQRLADAAAAEAEGERAELEDRLVELDASKTEAEGLRDEVQLRIVEWEAVGDQIEAADAAIATEIRRLEEELARRAAEEAAARRAAEEAAAREAAEAEAAAADEGSDEEAGEGADDEAGDETDDDEAPAAALVAGDFAVAHRPVPGPVTSAFGPRTHPIFGTIRNHYGIDFDGNTGDPITAVAPGTVLTAGWMNGYGNTVVISHGNGFSTLYAHQSSIAVAWGDTVAGGETIGSVGSTGWSTGPHLHFEIRIEGIAVDPDPYL